MIPMPSVEIFSQGEEVITGQTVDTNAAWLSERLFEMGFRITRHTAVGDRVDELISLLKEISVRADCCICTGGLGPTQDDLTAEAVSVAFNRPLLLDRSALHDISQYFVRLGRQMPEVNRKQAMMPQGAVTLDNDWGTAPGFALQEQKCWFAFVPGVPYEMRNVFRERIRPELHQRFDLEPWRLVTLRTVGIGESGIQQKLLNLKFPDRVILSFRTGSLENQTKLFFPPGFPEAELRRFAEQAALALGKHVFSIDNLDGEGGALVDVINWLLSEADQTLAIAETVSGGQIASRCGNQKWFVESLIVREVPRIFKTYDRQIPDFNNQQEVSLAVRQLAEIVVERAQADIGLVQLWCQNSGKLLDKTGVIQLYNGLATPTGSYYYACGAGGSAQRKQTVASTVALDMLRRYLQGYL